MAPQSPAPRSPGDIAGQLGLQAGGPPHPWTPCPGTVSSSALDAKRKETDTHSVFLHLSPRAPHGPGFQPPNTGFHLPSLSAMQTVLSIFSSRHKAAMKATSPVISSLQLLPPRVSSRSSLKLFYQRPARPRKTELESMLYSANSHLSLSP